MPKPTIPGKRIDPAPRLPDGAQPWDKLRNASNERTYTYVNPNDEMFGVSYYEGIGYEVERRRPGGPVPLVGKTQSDGDMICVMGQVLMSCPNDVKEQIDQYGVGGGGGQEYINKIEKKILKPGGVDGLRGMDGVFSVVNETSAPGVERG